MKAGRWRLATESWKVRVDMAWFACGTGLAAAASAAAEAVAAGKGIGASIQAATQAAETVAASDSEPMEQGGSEGGGVRLGESVREGAVSLMSAFSIRLDGGGAEADSLPPGDVWLACRFRSGYPHEGKALTFRLHHHLLSYDLPPSGAAAIEAAASRGAAEMLAAGEGCAYSEE